MAAGSPGNRLETGTAILAAAREVDVRLVKTRLAKFERANQAYADAQRRVEAAESDLRAAQVLLGERDVDQDEAVEALARALVADGHARANPFKVFGELPPFAVMRLGFEDEIAEVRRLASAVLRNKALNKPTLRAARAAVRAAETVQRALAPVAKLEKTVREARRTRDAIGQVWESAVAALKRGTRAAADDGAPQLDATLFKRAARNSAREGKPIPSPVPPQPEPAPAPVVASRS